jgi:phosphonopyruvate decarboxylase
MIHPERLYNYLSQQGVDFYTGVPDSLLKDFLKYVQDHSTAEKNIITANEGISRGLGIGLYLNRQAAVGLFTELWFGKYH